MRGQLNKRAVTNTNSFLINNRLWNSLSFNLYNLCEAVWLYQKMVVAERPGDLQITGFTDNKYHNFNTKRFNIQVCVGLNPSIS